MKYVKLEDVVEALKPYSKYTGSTVEPYVSFGDLIINKLKTVELEQVKGVNELGDAGIIVFTEGHVYKVVED